MDAAGTPLGRRRTWLKEIPATFAIFLTTSEVTRVISAIAFGSKRQCSGPRNWRETTNPVALPVIVGT